MSKSIIDPSMLTEEQRANVKEFLKLDYINIAAVKYFIGQVFGKEFFNEKGE